jgi:hypothetical protein
MALLLLLAEVFTQRLRDLRGVGALLKTDDDTVPQRPDVSEARLESSTGRLRSRRVLAKGDYAVAHFKEFIRFSVPVLKVSEQTREEATEHVIQSKINVAIGKAFDDFPAHVRREYFSHDFGITARVVKTLHYGDGVIFALAHHCP